MAHGIVNRSRSNPCPFCGKPDWCGRYPTESGFFVEFCKRTADRCDVLGLDGVTYKYVGETADGSAKFVAKDLYSASHAHIVQKKLEVINTVQVRDNVYLDEIYRYLLSLLVLDDDHCKYLQGEGWDNKMLYKYQIKSFPENDYYRYKYNNKYSKNPYRKVLARKVIEHFEEKYGKECLVGVPGAYKNSKGEWTFTGRSGILFPMYDVNGYLYRLRIRLDFLDVPGVLFSDGNAKYYLENNQPIYVQEMKGLYTINNGNKDFCKNTGKYRNFSSWREKKLEDCIINQYNGGCAANNQIAVYANVPNEKNFFCFITEGEKKGIFASEKMQVIVVSLPGVNSWSKLLEGKKGNRPIDILIKKGVGIFIVAFDADAATNEAVLKYESKTIQAIKKEGLAVGVAKWDILYGKGLDDLLASGHQPEYDVC